MNPDEPQFEKYWRDRIATELEEYIRAGRSTVRSEAVAIEQQGVDRCGCYCVCSCGTGSGA